jgi:hypothetical protein
MTTRYTTKESQLEALRMPFPKENILTREQGGKTLYYLPIGTLRDRLNAVMSGAFDIRSGEIIPGAYNIDMSCILTLHWADGTQSQIEEWGSSDVLMTRTGTSRANDPYKNASSDALRRCLMAVGCGDEMWDKKVLAEIEKARNVIPPRKPRDFQTTQGSTLPKQAPPPPARFAAPARQAASVSASKEDEY